MSPPPLPNPSSGSANPAASLSALWGYIEPALDHLLRSPTNDISKAPSVALAYHMGIYTATYNYLTSHCENPRDNHAASPPGADLYDQLDKYLAGTVRELLLGAPDDDSTLIHYIVPCFDRYSTGAHSVNRFLNYVNRHYVKRAVDEDKGWLRLNDVIESVPKSITPDDTPKKITTMLKERKVVELKTWGYVDGGSSDLLALAEACAEAASPPDRVIPVSSLAMRRFRTEFIEPLLAVPKVKKSKKPAGSGPRGRLARAAKALMESKVEERSVLAADLARVLRSAGVRPDHPLRKRLDKFLA
jgi:hypothetical protein